MDKLSSRLTPIDDLYPTCAHTKATFIIYPGDMDPEEVTQKLGVVPTRTSRKGECKPYRPGGGKRIVKISNWMLESEGEVASRDIRHHLDWVLDKIEPAAEQIRELQQHPGMIMVVNCSWGSAHGKGGPTLWPEQMRRMALLNLEWTSTFSYYEEGKD